MPNLQLHMLSVAAVAYMICDSIDVLLKKEDIITACLLHDMGNIIKSHLEYFPQFNEPEGMEYWQTVKDDYVKKYGTNEHHASLEIVNELGLSKEVEKLVDVVDFHHTYTIFEKTFEEQICLYVDSRVAPLGIMSTKERLAEGKNRYKDRPNAFSNEQWAVAEKNFTEIEKQIFSKCKIKPEDINDDSVAPIIQKLRDFVIK